MAGECPEEVINELYDTVPESISLNSSSVLECNLLEALKDVDAKVHSGATSLKACTSKDARCIHRSQFSPACVRSNAALFMRYDYRRRVAFFWSFCISTNSYSSLTKLEGVRIIEIHQKSTCFIECWEAPNPFTLHMLNIAKVRAVKMDILNLWSRKEKTQPDRLRISRNEFNIIRLIASLAEFRAWTSCSKDHPSKYFAVYYLTVSVVPNSYYHETLCSSLSIRRKTSFRFPHFKIWRWREDGRLTAYRAMRHASSFESPQSKIHQL